MQVINDDKPNKTSRAFRNQRYVFAVGGSIISKGLAFATQVLAIPIAIHWCGLPTYTLYLSLVAASLAPTMLLLRLGPKYVGMIATLHSTNDSNGIAAYFWKGMVLTTVSCLLAFLASMALIAIPNASSIFAGLTLDTVSLPLALLCGVSIIGGFCQTIEQVQCGFHETHYINLRAGVANVISCATLLTFVPLFPNVITLIVALQVIPLISRIVNSAIFILRYRVVFKDFRPQVCRVAVLSDALKFTFVAGFCAYMGVQAPLLLLATQTRSAEIAHASALSLQIVLQLLSIAGFLLVPSIPAIASAWAAADYESVRRYKNGISRILHGLCLIVVLTGFISGSLLSFKLGLQPQQGIILFGAAGLFFSVNAIEQFYFTHLLTIPNPVNASIIYAIVGAKSILIFMAALISVTVGAELYTLLIASLVAFVSSVVPLAALVQIHANVATKLTPTG